MNGSFVVSILTGITAVMAVALTIVNLLRWRRAATRHAVLTAAFAIALALPAASAIAPYVAIRVSVPAPAVLADAMASFDESRAPMPTDVVTSSADQAPAVQRPATVSLATVVTMIWLLGFVVCLAPVAIGLFEMRSLGGRGLPWAHGRALTDRLALSLGLRRRVGIVLHETVSGPMTYGTSRPTIVMPFDAEDWTDEQLTRAIVHELEHIRRADWMTQCLARTLCAAYWFHPLVWIARRQLVLEAERASDDAVLRYAEASAYADQLVDLARRLSAGHRPLLAMANRRDLAARVRALLDGRQPRGRAGAWLVAVVSCIAAALVLVMSPMRVVAGSQQPQTTGVRPHFDVVSVRPCDSNPPPSPPPSGAGRGAGAGGVSPQHFFLECRTVSNMIVNAYLAFNGGHFNEPSTRPIFDMLHAGPDWSRSEKFTIEATTSVATPPMVMHGPMLQAVLQDRFKLEMHRETREVPVYELVVAKGGAKVTPFKPGSCVPWDWSFFLQQPALEPGQHRCTSAPQMDSNGNLVQNVEAMTLDDWVTNDRVLLLGERPVVNKTGITGLQTFRLVSPAHSETPEERAAEYRKQLGLDLRSARGPREFLILDHVERPTPDAPLVVPARATGPGR
jgi:uncharacterized protein (TIGR03435 family)